MVYSLTYNLDTKPRLQNSASATSALHDHAVLLMKHAYSIVVRDARNRIVTLNDLVVQKRLEGRHHYQNDGNSD